MSEKPIPADVKVTPPPTHAQMFAWVWTDDRMSDEFTYLSPIYRGAETGALDPRQASDENRQHVRAALVTIRVPLSDLRYAR